jgi:lysozyme
MKTIVLYLALKSLVANEGFVPHPYELYGVWHIGFGYNLEEHYGEPADDCPEYSCLIWSREFAFEVLERDVRDVRERLRANVNCYDQLSVKARVVLIDMAYNMGVYGAISFKKTIAAMCAADYHWAAYHLLDSKYARKLPKRAERNAEILRGDYEL